MRSGCLGLLLALGVRVVSTILVAIGVALLLFGVFTFDPTLDVRMIVALIVVPIGAYLLYRAGRGVWRDLRAPPDRPKGKEKDRTPPQG
ncbi:MAG: hypothetical protein AB1425_01030 [Actinomycetota bacterium]